MADEKNLISEQESAVVGDDDCAFPTSESNTFVKVIGQTTYIAELHFKKEGQTFSEKLKRVLQEEGK